MFTFLGIKVITTIFLLAMILVFLLYKRILNKRILSGELNGGKWLI